MHLSCPNTKTFPFYRKGLQHGNTLYHFDLSSLQSFPMVLEWGTSWALGTSLSNPRSTERTSTTTRTTTRCPFFYQVTLISICFLSIPACSLQPNGVVLTQASMARLHFLLSPREKKRPREKKTFSSGSLHIRRLHLVLHRDRSDRRQSRLFGFSKSFCGF